MWYRIAGPREHLVGNFVDSRGKIPPLTDQLYVSPYLLRPLRRLEEVEQEAARVKGGAKRPPASANDDNHPASPAPRPDK